jgi:hypothetical protein
VSEIYIVYATTASGEKFALAAYAKSGDADAHVSRCKRADDNDSASAMKVLGLSDVYVHPLRVS